MPGKADTSLLPTPSKRRTVPLATPVYAGGLVICATPGNRFVASDAAAGATVWSCPIEPPDPPKKVEIFPGQARGPITIRPGSQLWEKDVSKESDRWVATEVIVCGDRLLLTPVDAGSLYCADLKTGHLLWDSPRGDGLYVVAAGPDPALIVGQKSLRAIRVENGQPAWEQAAYPDDAAAAGRGFLSGDRYALPLGSG
jgi:outer membrane protein assembly factor BamB